MDFFEKMPPNLIIDDKENGGFSGSNREKIKEEIKQESRFMFDDMKKRAEAMSVINEMRESNPEIFKGLISVKINSENLSDQENKTYSDRGLVMCFDNFLDYREQKIIDLFDKKMHSANEIYYPRAA